MLRGVLRVALDAVNVRPGEGRPLGMMLAQSFCLGASLVFFETAANALFLTHFGVESLAWVYVGGAALVTASGAAFSAFERRLRFTRLLVGTLLALVVAIVALRVALAVTEARWPSLALIACVDVITVVSGLAFWALAARMFDVRQGKRLFGLIGTGEVAAGILGGLLVPSLIGAIGTPNLLVLAGLSMLVSAALLLSTLRKFRDRLGAVHDEGEVSGPRARPLRALARDRYVVLVFALAVAGGLAYYLLTYVFYAEVEARHRSEEELASFFGLFLAATGALHLVLGVFLSGRLLARWGLFFGLAALPVALLATVVVAVAAGTFGASGVLLFWLVVLAKLLDEVLRGSFHAPATRTLYQPIAASERTRVVTAVETLLEPMTAGGIGLALLALPFFPSIATFDLSYGVLATAAATLGVAWLLRDRYRDLLASAFARRLVRGAALTLDDASSLEVLRRRLESPHALEVTYAFEVLESLEHPLLAEVVPTLLEHPEPIVRARILQYVERSGKGTSADVLLRLAEHDPSPHVRAAALRALAVLATDDPLETLSPYLDHPDDDICMAALVGLLRSGGIEGIVGAGERLNALLGSADEGEGERVLAARVLGQLGASLHRPLLVLLSDPSSRVRLAALGAAASVSNARVWPRVVICLGHRALRAAASSALLAAGDHAVPAVEAALDAPGQRRALGRVLLRLLGRMRDAQSLRALADRMELEDQVLRHQALASLAARRHRASGPQIERVKKLLVAEVDDWRWTARTRVRVASWAPLVAAALEAEERENRRALFALLALLHDADVLTRVRDRLELGSASERATAIELLDSTLAREQRDLVLPLLDPAVPLDAPRLGDEGPAVLADLLDRPDGANMPWAIVCALHAAGVHGITELTDRAERALDSPAAVVRESALWALDRLAPSLAREAASRLLSDPAHHVAARARCVLENGDVMSPSSMLTLEKLIILKAVSMFAGIPDSELAQLVRIVSDEHARAGEIILEKGEIGRSMYVMASGRVRVHDGERILAELGEREVFGELAALDPERRLASVTALEDTHLFRLDHEALYEIMSEHVELARGVIQVLCARTRVQAETAQAETAQAEPDPVDEDEPA